MIDTLPTLNAILNTTSAVLLFIGHRHALAKRFDKHKRFMLAALGTSVLFLCSYLTYHSFHGTTHFTGGGWIRPVYFVLLGSHTVLAAAIVPLVLITLRRGLRDDRQRHRQIAKITYPLWLYVSVTGVLIYLLLYHIYA